MSMLNLKLVLRLWNKEGKLKYYQPMYFNRFIQLIRHTSFIKAYAKVSYGKKICNFGCLCEFTNEGEAENKKDLVKMVKYFLE